MLLCVLFLYKYYIDFLGTHFERYNSDVMAFLLPCASKIFQEETWGGEGWFGICLIPPGTAHALGARARQVVKVHSPLEKGCESYVHQLSPAHHLLCNKV